MAKAKLPDGSILEVSDGATVVDLAAQIGPGLARVALAAKINDRSTMQRPAARDRLFHEQSATTTKARVD